MTQYFSTLLRFSLVQVVLLAICSAYPYVLSSDFDLSEIGRHPAAHLVKRAFDRVESNDFGLFKRALDKRSFDRIDMADFGLRRKRAFDRIARAEFGFEGLRRKRAFDRLSIADFGLRRKRAFDRLSGTEFGLVKRSADAPDSARDELIHDLASSIVAMRSSNAPLDVRSVDSKK